MTHVTISLTKGLSILLMFSKNLLLVSRFSICHCLLKVLILYYLFKYGNFLGYIVASSVECPTLDFCSGHDSSVMGLRPHLALRWAWACLRFSLWVSLSFPQPLSPACALSLSQNKKEKKRNLSEFYCLFPSFLKILFIWVITTILENE